MADDPLAGFHPVVRRWFERALGSPTLAQALGWPRIQSGENALILAPTGSGKTLAAFLSAIDHLLRAGLEGRPEKGVFLLYISPLKALNYDIEKNLRAPLERIYAEMREDELEPPDISVGVRTGDTPSRDRAKMARKPPQILITTPESLNLILSSRARTMLANVRQVVVDEIHSLAPNKRGAFLSVLLERLEDVSVRPPVRIGLSATQRPLEEVAQFLGGFGCDGKPRPVAIVDASGPKKLRVQVRSAVPSFRRMKKGELWPAVEAAMLDEICSHRSTLVFANNRRTVERLALNINEMASDKLVEPHHGSISPARRKETETRLKSGALRGVIATSTLELGIDMGSIDLVCQIGSPKTVSGGLQRVGRAGHLYGATSEGIICATSSTDLLEAAVIARQMQAGEVERIQRVRCPLDVLAQQIAAMCVHGPMRAADVLAVARRSACFHGLPDEAFWRTVEMVSGRLGGDLSPRVSYDPIKQELHPLPGTLRSVVTSGGVIPDTGQFPVYLSGTRLPIGELDEEFVWEAREGESFRLGTSLWHIESIEADRIFVRPTAGVPAKVPFWRGELVFRSVDLGRAIGEFLRQAEGISDAGNLRAWIRQYADIDEASADNLAELIERQRTAGGLPTDRRIVVESYLDPLGENRVVIVSTFGARVHQALRIAVIELVRRACGVSPESIATDEGVLVRLPAEAPDAMTIARQLTPDRFGELVEAGLASSPLFGLHFRQNAARALLLPGARPGKRSPLWLQRLKSKDLLQKARAVPGFPVVAETIRECKNDYMDVPATADLLKQIQSGQIELALSNAAAPSPFASHLEFLFNGEFMYVWDTPIGQAVRPASEADSRIAALAASGQGIDSEALVRMRERAQHLAEGSRARSASELAEILRELGPLTTLELAQRTRGGSAQMADELRALGRTAMVNIGGQQREALSEEAEIWESSAGSPEENESFWRDRAADFIKTNPGCRSTNYQLRYGLPAGLAERAFREAEARGVAVLLEAGYVSSELLESARRITLALRREEARPVSLEQFQWFVLGWQKLLGQHEVEGQEGLVEVVHALAGAAAPAAVWEADLLARRMESYNPSWLDAALVSGQISWMAIPGTGTPGDIAVFPRGLGSWLSLGEPDESRLSQLEQRVLDHLRAKGASFLTDIGLGIGEDTRKIEQALGSLAWRGLVSQDSFEPLRKRGQTQSQTPVEQVRTAGSARQRLRMMKRLRPSPNPSAIARWSLVGARAALDEESIEMLARLLLERYGVLTRDVAAAADSGAPWSALYRVLERMELTGEIERGWYVDGMGGAQFALSEAATALRNPESPTDRLTLVNSCDPALVSRKTWISRAGSYVVLRGGRPVLLAEAGAKRLTPLSTDAEALEAAGALAGIVKSPWPMRPVRRLEVVWWDQREVEGTAIADELRRHGFSRTPKGLVL